MRLRDLILGTGLAAMVALAPLPNNPLIETVYATKQKEPVFNDLMPHLTYEDKLIEMTHRAESRIGRFLFAIHKIESGCYDLQPYWGRTSYDPSPGKPGLESTAYGPYQVTWGRINGLRSMKLISREDYETVRDEIYVFTWTSNKDHELFIDYGERRTPSQEFKEAYQRIAIAAADDVLDNHKTGLRAASEWLFGLGELNKIIDPNKKIAENDRVLISKNPAYFNTFKNYFLEKI